MKEEMNNRYYAARGFHAIKGFFVNYFNFTGRSTRSEYWWWQIIPGVCGIVMSMTMAYRSAFNTVRLVNQGVTQAEIIQRTAHQDVLTMFFGDSLWLKILAVVIFILLLVPTTSLNVRRFADVGIHWGWYAGLFIIGWADYLIPPQLHSLRMLVSVIVSISILVIALLPSQSTSPAVH